LTISSDYDEINSKGKFHIEKSFGKLVA